MKSVFLFIAFFSATLLSAQTAATKPFVIGVIDSVQSKELNETRILNIYLPEGYSPDSAKAYPVIYLLDGSADEDFIHISGLVQFCNFPWIDLIPQSIVVGISNIDRKRDFTFPTTIEQDKKDFPTTGSSEKFIAFIEKELQPYIQKNYHTNHSKMLIGQSLGGLLATEILFKKSELFTQYLIVSPSLWWDNESLLKLKAKCLQTEFKQETQVYIAVGKEGRTMVRDAKRLHRILKHAGKKNLKTGFGYFKDKNHATIMHLAVFRGFEFLGMFRG